MKDYSVPIPVVRSLKFLGQNLRQARIKRRLTMALVEERASITHVTLTKIEKGEVTVSMANYAKVMFVLGFIDELSKIINLSCIKIFGESVDFSLAIFTNSFKFG